MKDFFFKVRKEIHFFYLLSIKNIFIECSVYSRHCLSVIVYAFNM